jgi:negative regulator of sigma E activity
MTDQNEHISILLDDELSEDRQSKLTELLGDVNQRDTLGRYRMVGDVLRHEIPRQVRTDFAAEMRAKMEQEACHVSAQSAPAKTTGGLFDWLGGWLWKPVAGMAVAAAVALVTVSSLQSPLPGASDESVAAVDDRTPARVEQLASTPVLQANIRSVSTASSTAVPENSSNWKIRRDQAKLQSKLNAYLINHNEFSDSLNGIIPQARVVGFDDLNR